MLTACLVAPPAARPPLTAGHSNMRVGRPGPHLHQHQQRDGPLPRRRRRRLAGRLALGGRRRGERRGRGCAASCGPTPLAAASLQEEEGGGRAGLVPPGVALAVIVEKPTGRRASSSSASFSTAAAAAGRGAPTSPEQQQQPYAGSRLPTTSLPCGSVSLISPPSPAPVTAHMGKESLSCRRC